MTVVLVETFVLGAAEVHSGKPALVDQQFAQLRRIPGTQEPAYQVLPEFAVYKVTLDQHKMITAGITFS